MTFVEESKTETLDIKFMINTTKKAVARRLRLMTLFIGMLEGVTH